MSEESKVEQALDYLMNLDAKGAHRRAEHIATIRAELDKLAADARRYRWLRDKGSGSHPQRGVTIISNEAPVVHLVYWVAPGALDENIDRAMGEQP